MSRTADSADTRADCFNVISVRDDFNYPRIIFTFPHNDPIASTLAGASISRTERSNRNETRRFSTCYTVDDFLEEDNQDPGIFTSEDVDDEQRLFENRGDRARRFSRLVPPHYQIEDNPAVLSFRLIRPGRIFLRYHPEFTPDRALDKPRRSSAVRSHSRAGLRLKIARCRCLTKPVSFGSASLGVYTKVVCESAERATTREW